MSASQATSPLGAHSRNRSPKCDKLTGSANLGTGFRFRGQGSPGPSIREEQAAANPPGLPSEFGTTASVKDSDAVSTTSSMPTSASVQNQPQQAAAQQQQAAAAGHDSIVVAVASPPGYRSADALSKTTGSVGSKIQTAQLRPVLQNSGQRRPSPLGPVTAGSSHSQPRPVQQGRVVGAQPAMMGGVGSGQVTPQTREAASMVRTPGGGAGNGQPPPQAREAASMVRPSAGGVRDAHAYGPTSHISRPSPQRVMQASPATTTSNVPVGSPTSSFFPSSSFGRQG